MYDASVVDVVKRGDELSHERSRDVLGQSPVLLTLDVRQQLATLGVLGHQAVQRRRLTPTSITRILVNNMPRFRSSYDRRHFLPRQPASPRTITHPV